MQTSFPELSARELAAWRGFLRVHSGIVRELNTELELTHALPLAHYEVLLYLDAAPCGKLTMSELAQSVLLSQSGVTRLVDRLVRSGLVVREGCSEDRRVMYARLTDEGLYPAAFWARLLVSDRFPIRTRNGEIHRIFSWDQQRITVHMSSSLKIADESGMSRLIPFKQSWN